MAGQSLMLCAPRILVWENLERESLGRIFLEPKTERIVLPKPFPNQPRCAHVLRIAADTNQPLTRAPTRTPCGETGSEDSWLRVLGGPTSIANNSPIILSMWVRFNFINLIDLVAEFLKHDLCMYKL